ncbi:hypothetical protein KC363_g219 [Hortaea werneckii]|nr:hypothetical protein KC363_g219 [Hortaea werneckii]
MFIESATLIRSQVKSVAEQSTSTRPSTCRSTRTCPAPKAGSTYPNAPHFQKSSDSQRMIIIKRIPKPFSKSNGRTRCPRLAGEVFGIWNFEAGSDELETWSSSFCEKFSCKSIRDFHGVKAGSVQQAPTPTPPAPLRGLSLSKGRWSTALYLAYSVEDQSEDPDLGHERRASLAHATERMLSRYCQG